jgi:hypothetical protein
MQLAFRNAQGSVRTSWSDYALLRDNVQHYLENGAPTERFAALHGIERAVDGRHAVLDAARLRSEVLGAWFALKKLDLESSAVSLRTHLVLSGSVPPPRVRGTLLAARAAWELPVSVGSEQPLGEVLRAFVAAVLAVTETAVDGDRLVVSRERVGSKANDPARPLPARRRAAAAAKRRHGSAASRNNVRRKRDRA